MKSAIAMAVMTVGLGACSAAPHQVEEVSAVVFSVAADAAVDPEVAGGVALAHEDARRVDHLERAGRLEQSGDLEGALVEARRAAFDRPDRGSFGAVVRLAGRTRALELALEGRRALCQLETAQAADHVALAQALLEAGRSAQAEQAASEAVGKSPSMAEAWHLRGLARLRLGSLAAAAADFEQVTRLNPRHAWAWNNQGYARLLMGEPARAVAPLERARALAPHLAYVHNNLGVALERLGRLADAHAAYSKALELDPGHAHAAANFARAAEALGWAGPAAGETDAGASEPGGWVEEFERAGEGARAWLLEAGIRAPGDGPSGADVQAVPCATAAVCVLDSY